MAKPKLWRYGDAGNLFDREEAFVHPRMGGVSFASGGAGRSWLFLFFFLSFDNLYAHGYAFMVSLMRLTN